MELKNKLEINKALIEAFQYHKKNNFKDAENIYQKILKNNPKHFETIFYLGTLYSQLKKYDLAEPLFQKAILINPSFKDTYQNLGFMYQQLGDYQKAKKYYEKLIQIDPENIKVYYILGVIYQKLGIIEKAKDYFKKVIKIDPNYIDAHNNLGICYQQSESYLNAINSYIDALRVNPNYIISLNNLSLVLKSIKFTNLQNNDLLKIKKIFLFLFKKNNINHSEIFNNAKLFLFNEEEKKYIKKTIYSKSKLLNNEIIKEKCEDEFFHLLLQKSLVIDKFLENLLIKIRFELIYFFKKKNIKLIKKYKKFFISLAEQCWLNEYIYYQTAEEVKFIDELKKKLENNNQVNEEEIIILSCYFPLYKSNIITKKILNYKSSNDLFNNLILIQVKEPLNEIRLKNSIKSLNKISDSVSKKVRDQYEDNPYPRWKYCYQYMPENFITILNNEIEPNKVKYDNKFIKPEVLIAGCGTGNHLIHASKYKNAKITGIDLSLSSLAYAKRKIEELSLNNIDIIHADILDLKNLNKEFDIIESVGTIHHMKDPVEGLKILLQILKPHGYLKIGLYSELARDYVVKSRELIKKKQFNNNIEDIRECRKLIFNEKDNSIIQNITKRADFYSTSNVRDLIFHVQEHRFTIPEISKIIKNLDLEFLGFNNSLIKSKFLKSNSRDKILSLKDWDLFENKNPTTFVGMYQFWVKKII
jgi:Tfp pilus assembly protein PilF/SAM-dependent methyltransferase